jgi:hypothetical protein
MVKIMSEWNYETIKRFAQQSGCSISDLIVLAPQNDPYYIGTQTEKRHARWIAEIVTQFLEERNRIQVHDRAIHYYILSNNFSRPIGRSGWRVYRGDSNDFSWAMKSIQNARILGYIPWSCIEDKKNPELIRNARYWEHDEFEDISITPEDIAKAIYEKFYPFNPQLQQAYHVEIWTEKTTINDILEPIAEGYGVNIQAFSGQSTSTKVYELIQRISEINKPVRILYISDYDSYGHNMPVACGRKIQWFLDNMDVEQDVKLDKILLTAEQVEEYALPSAPDSRNKVEIDALEVYHPGETEKIVEAAISKYIDVSLKREIRERNRQVQRMVFEAVMEHEDFIRKLIKSFDLSKVEEMFYDPLPEAEKIPEENEALFNSQRDYLKQVNRFKEHLKSRED